MKNATKKVEVKKKVVAPKAPVKKVPAKAVAKKKPVSKKKSSAKKVATKKGPEMISYSIKMTIPTGAYANIVPEIVVKAGDIDQAHAFIAPHMNKLWKEYYMVSERPVTPTKPAPVAPKAEKPAETAPKSPELPVDEGNKVNCADVVPPAPASAVAFDKASKAIASCMSKEALELIATQVEKSVKLSDENKVALREIVANKSKELAGK